MFSTKTTFEGFDGNTYTETSYFNMTRVELMRWQAETNDNLAENMREAVEDNDFGKIITYFEELIRRSYGEKSDDGKRFIKNAQKTEDFMSSPVYDELFWRITQDPKQAEVFLAGVIPDTKGISNVKQPDSVGDQNNVKAVTSGN